MEVWYGTNPHLWAGIHACLMKFCPPDVSSWRPDGDIKRCPQSFLAEIDRSFIPFALMLIHQLWSGNDPTAGTGRFPRAEKMVWNAGWGGVEAFSILYCAVSSNSVSALQLFCSLWFNWSSGKAAAAQPVTRWILSWQFSEMTRVWPKFSTVRS